MNAESFLQSADLESCKKELFKQVKAAPSDVKLRIFLFQLFCITQDWKRATTQLDVIKDLDESTMALVNTYTQLIECEQKRQDVLNGKKEPTCFGEPSEWLAYYVQAYKKYISGDYSDAFKLIEQGAEGAPEITGKIDKEHNFAWLSDGDIRFGPSIEVIVNGGYYWLPMENIEEIAFEPVDDLRDLVWRPANLTLKNKGKLIVFIPTRYPINTETTDPQLLARTCEWQEPSENFFIGQGQRIFLSDDKEYPLLNISTINFNVE